VAQDAVRKDVVEVLGTVRGVEVAVAVTSEPWLLPVTALVLSVGSGLGGLATAAQRAFPDASWRSLEVDPLAAGRARVLEIGRPTVAAAPPLRAFIAAGVGDVRHGKRSIVDAVGRAAAVAVREAQRIDVSTLAMPLLGSGHLGLDAEEAARIVLPAVGDQLWDSRKSNLRGLVFVGVDGGVSTALRRAWRAVHAEQLEAEVQPLSSGQDGSGGATSSARFPYSGPSSAAVEVLGRVLAGSLTF